MTGFKHRESNQVQQLILQTTVLNNLVCKGRMCYTPSHMKVLCKQKKCSVANGEIYVQRNEETKQDNWSFYENIVLCVFNENKKV